MHAIDRKLVRDLWQMKGQAIAIGLVVACGMATFVMSLATLESLTQTRNSYYERYRFAEVFAHCKRAPNHVAERIAEIPGVAQVETRIVGGVTLNVPDLSEPATGRLISVPDTGRPMLNDLYLRRGRYLEPGRSDEVLASEGFADTHGFEPGDKIKAVIYGKERTLTIVGIALSPEYIYQLKEGDMLPDDRRFGVFWMRREELAAAFGMTGAFNDVTLTLTPDALEAEVLRQLDLLTEPYGGLGAHGRQDQVSHQFVSNEIAQLRGMAKIAPTIFLSVAAFLLNVVMTRIVRTQREQIAALKAFGYGNWEVGWHYLKFVLIITLLGAALGAGVGVILGRGLTEMYTRFFRFPEFGFDLPLAVVLIGTAISCGAAMVGTIGAVRQAVRLPPAQAMRPEPPADYRPTFVERLGLQNFLPQTVRMILRNLERQPIKSFFSVLGIATAVGVLVLGNFMHDAITYVMESQFEVAQRHDLTVTFIEPSGPDAIYALQQLPGVKRCEPFRGLGVRIRSEHRSRRVGVTALRPDAELNRVMDVYRNPVPLPAEGVVLSHKLAEILHVRVGEHVTIEVLEGTRPVREVLVQGLVDDFAGISAYMEISAVNRLMREGNLVSGAFLEVDPLEIDALYAELKQSPRVAGVTIKDAALQSFRETVAENLLRFRLFNVAFATIIAFGVVYNSARISLAERSRELATLRVIGFTRGEISAILLGELGVLTLLAIPLGLLIGTGFAHLVVIAGDVELFRIPVIIYPATYAFAVTVVLIAALMSGLVVRRRLDHLDLVAVLKTKE